MDLNWNGELKTGPAIGIDLGTTNSVVAVFFQGKVQIIQSQTGTNSTPSYVAFKKDGGQVIGKFAQDLSFIDPENTFYDVKRIIGRRFDDKILKQDIKLWPYQVVGENNEPRLIAYEKAYTPEDVSKILLSSFKEQASKKLGCPITKAVITVPAYFNNAQKRATLKAGQLAGLEILNIISEPTAAAISYKLQRFNKKAKNVMVFNLGGGTFDVAVLDANNKIEIRSIGGNAHLGGADFDHILMNHCLQLFDTENADLNRDFEKQHLTEQLTSRQQNAKLLAACEEAKKQLSFIPSTTIYVANFVNGRNLIVTVTRKEFEDLVDALFLEMLEIVKKTLKTAKIRKKQIDDIVMVGGATKIPKLQSMIRDFFKGKALNLHIIADEAVAYGAAMQAALINAETEAKSMINFESINDVIPISYGIEANIGTKSGRFTKVIEKNTKYPTEKVVEYVTSRNTQDTVTISIYQGEEDIAKNNFSLGDIILKGFFPKGRQRIYVTMKITEYGILKVYLTLKI